MNKTCENCRYWEGTATAWLAACIHPQTARAASPFDSTCPGFVVRTSDVDQEPNEVQRSPDVPCPQCGSSDTAQRNVGYVCRDCLYTWT